MPTLDLYQDCECNTYLSLVFYFTTYPKHAVGNAEIGFVVQLYDRNVTLFGNKLHVYLGNPSQERETYGNLCIVWTDESAYTCYDGWLWYWYFRQPSYRYLLLSIASSDTESSLPHHPQPPTPRSQVHSIFLGMFYCITSYTSTMLLLYFSVGTNSRLLLDIIHICFYSRRLKYITPASFRTRFFNVRFCFS